MSYSPPSIDAIHLQLLVEYRNLINGADVSSDSEIYARAMVAAGAAAQISYGLKYVERQIFPDTADSDNLDRHAGLYGLERKDPTAATGGIVRLTGTNGTVVAAGLTLYHDDGTEFVTTTGGTITLGSLQVSAEAVTEGTDGNKAAGDELTVQSPPAGVDSTASVWLEFSGGTDEESDAELLARVLTRMRAGNAGGTHTDYEQWALEVDGVYWADTLELRLGPGTVSVAVFSEGAGGVRTPGNGALRSAVSNYLETVRPVCAEVDVPLVTEVALDVTITDLEAEAGFDADDVKTDVEAAIPEWIYELTTGDTAYLSQLGRAIASVDGVKDYTITAPTANQTVTVDSSTVEIFKPGTISVTLA